MVFLVEPFDCGHINCLLTVLMVSSIETLVNKLSSSSDTMMPLDASVVVIRSKNSKDEANTYFLSMCGEIMH